MVGKTVFKRTGMPRSRRHTSPWVLSYPPNHIERRHTPAKSEPTGLFACFQDRHGGPGQQGEILDLEKRCKSLALHPRSYGNRTHPCTFPFGLVITLSF